MSSMTRLGGWLELKLKHDLGSDYVAPASLLRGSLFSSETFRGVKRPQEAAGELAVSNGKLSITRLRGLQLDQYDLEVLCVVIKMSAKMNAEHDQVKLTIKRETMLHDLGWTHGGVQCKRLERSFEKLSNQQWLIHIDDDYNDINEEIELVKAERCGTAYNVTLNTKAAKLLFKNGQQLIRRSVREKLDGDNLAKHLHAYVSSFSGKTEVKIENIKKLTGRESQRNDRFMNELTDSVENLKVATGWEICELKNGNLVIEKKARAEAVQQAKVEEPAQTTASKKQFNELKHEIKVPKLEQVKQQELDYDDDELTAELADMYAEECANAEAYEVNERRNAEHEDWKREYDS